MKTIIRKIILSGFVLSLVSVANADIRINGAYQGVVQSKGYGKAACSVTLNKGANSYQLKVSVCSANAKSCMNAKFQGESDQSALSVSKLDRALNSLTTSRLGTAIFKSQGYANGGEEVLVGRLNSSGELVQVMYTTGAWLYPVYIVCGNLVRN